MRQYIGAFLVGALALSACQAKLPTGSTPKKTNQTASKPQAASPATAPAPVTGVPLSGTVRVDAAYMVKSGGGVVAAGGANVVAAGGGNVISAGGGNVISAGGGNVISAGGANFRVAAADAPAVGTILPVKGMAVQAIDMATGKPIGQPVATDDQGRFTLGVPEGLENNVLLVARVPGSEDTRLRYDLVAAPTKSDTLAIDEDSATVARYMRRCMVTRFAAFLNDEIVNGSVEEFVRRLNLPEFAATAALPAFKELQQKAKDSGLNKLSQAEREPYAQRFADALLARVKLESMVINPMLHAGDKSVTGHAVTRMTEVLRAGREAAAVKMKADPAYFTNQDYLKKATRWKSGIERPADLGEFVVTEYMGDVTINAFSTMEGLYESVGVPKDKARVVEPAATTITYMVMAVMVFNTEARAEALKAFDMPAAP
ncbi:MAG: hypothetical protein ACK46X_06690 [Candidatus Sericytochromatia bacterium]